LLPPPLAAVDAAAPLAASTGLTPRSERNTSYLKSGERERERGHEFGDTSTRQRTARAALTARETAPEGRRGRWNAEPTVT
jgi:hypothetical protein